MFILTMNRRWEKKRRWLRNLVCRLYLQIRLKFRFPVQEPSGLTGRRSFIPWNFSMHWRSSWPYMNRHPFWMQKNTRSKQHPDRSPLIISFLQHIFLLSTFPGCVLQGCIKSVLMCWLWQMLEYWTACISEINRILFRFVNMAGIYFWEVRVTAQGKTRTEETMNVSGRKQDICIREAGK